MQPNEPITLLIVDDHELVRDGIRARLEDVSDITIVGEGENGLEALELCETLKPDVLMMDISMPVMSGLDAVEELKRRDLSCHVLMLSLYDNQEYVARARTLGANGYILKDVSQEEMIKAIRNACKGDFYTSAELEANCEKDIRNDPYSLTEREREILSAIAKGQLNKQIAGDLNISVRTVESHRSAIRQKTGGGNAAMLAKIATDLGLA